MRVKFDARSICYLCLIPIVSLSHSIYGQEIEATTSEITIKAPNGSQNVRMGPFTFTATDSVVHNYGSVDVYEENDTLAGRLLASPTTKAGHLALWDSTGYLNSFLTVREGNFSHGWMGVFDETASRAYMTIHSVRRSGRVVAAGPNGNKNVWLTSWSNDRPNNGVICLIDSTDTVQAFIGVDNDGNGVVSADIKNFRTPHPLHQDQDIWYASLEGPEAGAYVRGTARLEGGRGVIALPDHFRHVAAYSGVTIILTPLSIQSKGLAVVEKNMDDGVISVGEMFEGTGSYEFDWEVKAVRKGYENYKVVRSKSYLKMSDSNDKSYIGSAQRR